MSGKSRSGLSTVGYAENIHLNVRVICGEYMVCAEIVRYNIRNCCGDWKCTYGKS